MKKNNSNIMILMLLTLFLTSAALAQYLIISSVAHPVPWTQDNTYAAAFSWNSSKACRGLLNPSFSTSQYVLLLFGVGPGQQSEILE